MNSLDPSLLSKFQRLCPMTHRALTGRRYLLPRKLESAFANQDHGLQRRILILLGSVLAPEPDSFARKAELINLLVGLRYDLPTLYLDPDFGEALLRTDLPSDFTTTDIRFPWGGFRLMMPLGLHLGDKDGDEVLYVDIALYEKDDLIRLDQKLLDDLYAASSQMIFMRRRSFDLPKKRKPPQPEAEL